MALNPIPAVTSLTFPVAACPCLGVWGSMPHEKSQAYTGRHASTLPSHGGVFIWTNSNTSASLFTSRLIHHLHSSIEGGKAGAMASLCVCVCVHGSMCDRKGGWGGGWGWMINQTTSTQAPNTLTRQGIYIPLHSCQEIGQQWIITPGRV